MSKCAFEAGKMCHAVTEKKCKFCHFRKTAEELRVGREKATERLMKLDRETLNNIKRKYYKNGGYANVHTRRNRGGL